MKKIAVLFYGVIVYFFFLATFMYMVGFIGNLFVPKGIDGPLEVPFWQAVLTNLGLIALFGIQHSLMARAWFKKWWTNIIPEVIERSTYVLFTVLVLIVLFIFWQPLGYNLWAVEDGMLYGIIMAIFALGWTVVLVSTFLIDHFDLFGLRQVWLYAQDKPYQPLQFQLSIFYNYVRHPLYFGFILALWAAPVMSIARFVLAAGLSIYILLAIQWEEKDLVQQFGETYKKYKMAVPMLIPFLIRKRKVYTSEKE